MLNPFKLLAIYNILNKVNAKAKEMTMQNWKTTIFGVIAGAALALGNYGGPNTWQGYLAAAAVAALGVLAQDFDVKLPAGVSAAVQSSISKLPAVLLAIGLMAMCAGRANAQAAPPAATTTNVSNLYMAGASYSPAVTPTAAGTALYAHEIGDSNTYAFTLIDAAPESLKPFTVTNNVGAGIAQQLFTIGKASVWVPTSVGVSWTGQNVGWSWSTGAGVPFQIGKTDWYVMPTVRVLKSSVAGATGYQPIIGVLFGWGQ